MTPALDLDQIRLAAATLAGQAIRTPIVSSPELDHLTGARVTAKVEAEQRTGSFKFRGAFNRLSQIPDEARPAGVVAVSSGNHGAAVAEAARLLGLPAHVFVPVDAPKVKRRLIEGAGAEIHDFDRSIPDREAPARSLAAELEATFVHPFEDPAVMAGQGTTALELIDQVDQLGLAPLEVVVVPIGGGGLMAGCGTAIRALWPDCRLIGVEPEVADDTRRSLAAGRPVRIPQPTTVADGLAVPSPGAATFAINHGQVDEILTVAEDEILDAVEVVARTLDVVVEPSGAVGIAALIKHRPEAGSSQANVGVILTGGNTDRPQPETRASETSAS